MNEELQLGHIQDQLIEHGLILKKHEGLFQQLSGDINRVDGHYKDLNEKVIRMDEQVKGIREQNTSHHNAQTESMKIQTAAIQEISSSLGILLAAMGVDIKDSKSMAEMRENFYLMKMSTQSKKASKDYFMRAAITAAVIALFGLLGLGVTTQINKGTQHEMGYYQNGPQAAIPQLRNR